MLIVRTWLHRCPTVTWMQWNVCCVYLTNYINRLLAKKRKIQSFHTHNCSVYLGCCYDVTRNAHKAFYISEETSPNHAQTVIIFCIICHLFLFILQTGSFATISNLRHYIAFYNYTKIGACNQWCTIVQLTKWTNCGNPTGLGLMSLESRGYGMGACGNPVVLTSLNSWMTCAWSHLIKKPTTKNCYGWSVTLTKSSCQK